jgi:hypothetical protein
MVSFTRKLLDHGWHPPKDSVHEWWRERSYQRVPITPVTRTLSHRHVKVSMCIHAHLHLLSSCTLHHAFLGAALGGPGFFPPFFARFPSPARRNGWGGGETRGVGVGLHIHLSDSASVSKATVVCRARVCRSGRQAPRSGTWAQPPTRAWGASTTTRSGMYGDTNHPLTLLCEDLAALLVGHQLTLAPVLQDSTMQPTEVTRAASAAWPRIGSGKQCALTITTSNKMSVTIARSNGHE